MSRFISIYTIRQEVSGAKGSMVEVPIFDSILIDDISESVWVNSEPKNDTLKRTIKYEYDEWDKLVNHLR